MVLLKPGQTNKAHQDISGNVHKSIIEAIHLLITSALEIQKI